MTNGLKEQFGDRLLENESMSKHLNFRIGGPAKYLVEVKNEEEVLEAIRHANEEALPYFVLGGGSNTLCSDEGYDGLVIKIGMRDFKIDGTTLYAEAGAISAAVARKTGDAGLDGFIWAVSLPGTIGGAVRGNAGCFGGEVKDNLVSARVVRDGKIVPLHNAEFEFGYRHSVLKGTNDVVLSAIFELKPANTEELKMRMKDILEKRKATQPMAPGSAGCLFKNYEIESNEELWKLRDADEIPVEMLDARRVSAGWLIDHAGLKGTAVGYARVSDEHGNFCMNTGGATAADVRALAELIKKRVQEKFGVGLHEEVQFIGF